MAHSRLIGLRQLQEQLKHGDYQRMTIFQRHRTNRPVGETPGQTESQAPLALSLDSGQPQIMRVFKHRQALAPIQLHGEFGAEVVKRFVLLQGSEDLPGQVAGVEQHLPVDACARAQHQIAYIVAGRIRRAEARGEQTFNQRGLLLCDATNLQVGPVSRLDH
ncbi:hypothetical protein D9M69_571750 [compost metagenome]